MKSLLNLFLQLLLTVDAAGERAARVALAGVHPAVTVPGARHACEKKMTKMKQKWNKYEAKIKFKKKKKSSKNQAKIKQKSNKK